MTTASQKADDDDCVCHPTADANLAASQVVAQSFLIKVVVVLALALIAQVITHFYLLLLR